MDFSYEQRAINKGYVRVCGVDEAGRGPLAGPVYAAAVILPFGCEIDGLNDSKKLSEKRRDELFDVITEKATAYCVASASVEEIDSLNILQATYLAMQRAIAGLSPAAQAAIIDGNRLPKLDIPAITVVKGDSKSPSIAAASILAKVSRDRYMYELDRSFPEYGYSQHKGYGTRLHYELLAQHGISEHHRRSFLKNLEEHINGKR